MDELVHHCLREIAFDGDLGCTITRLRDFIVGFHEHHAFSHPQSVDEAYCAFVWSLVVQQPTVVVGVVPPGECTEVYIAPQTSAKRKAKERGEEHREAAPATTLDVIGDAKSKPLQELIATYGDTLRIAVDPETSFAAITGSHIRPSKLSPMVYTSLQLVTRGRENGISVTELGKKSRYDQKTCHYLVNQLLDLDLVVKIRRGGVGTHFCIHKYFFERSPLWRQIRDEEAQGNAALNQQAATEQAEQEEDMPPEGASAASRHIAFDPIDGRHLSSLPLLKGRIVKLLQNSNNYIHASQNLILTIGFSNPTKTDRRFFNTRLNELIQQGVVEKLYVPRRSKSRARTWIPCIRLITPNSDRGADVPGAVAEIPGADVDGKEADVEGIDEDEEEDTGLRFNLSLHKQMINLLEEAGTQGMTLTELSSALGQFDRRTIELLLSRLEKYPPPSHLSDLGVAELMETHGRERRHRYYTVAAYRALVEKEQLHDSTSKYASADFIRVGDFAEVDESLFYYDMESLQKHVDSIKGEEKAAGTGKPIGRPRKSEGTGATKGKKKPATKTKVSSDGFIVTTAEENGDAISGRKRKRAAKGQAKMGEQADTADVDEASGPQSKRRKVEGDGGDGDSISIVVESGTTISAPTPKRRGRPPKPKPSLEEQQKADQDAAPRKKRGRPPRNLPKADAISQTLDSTTQDGADITTSAKPPPKRRGRQRKSRLSSIPLVDHVQEEDVSRTAIGDTGVPSTNAGPSLPQENIASEGMLDASPLSALTELTMSTPEAGSILLDQEHECADAEDSHADSMMVETGEINPQISLPNHAPPSNPASLYATPLTPVLPEGLLGFDDDMDAIHTVAPNFPIDPLLLTNEDANAGTSANHEAIEGAQYTIPSSTEGSDGQVRDAKRTASPAVVDRPSKKAKVTVASTQEGSSRSKVNVSHLRRENELLRLIERLGGMAVTTSKEFIEAHAALIGEMAQAGEPTSGPVGVRLDRRTIESTLDNLQRRRQIMTLKTSVRQPMGAQRPATVAYLPSISQEALNNFLADLSQNGLPIQAPAAKRLDEPVGYGLGQNQSQRRALPLQLMQQHKSGKGDGQRWCRNIARADQLFTYDDDTIRDVLLTETNTLAQLYGFKVGKAIRARELHMHMLKRFEANDPSPRIVSLEKRIIHVSYLYTDLPTSTYFATVSGLVHDDRLMHLLETEEGKTRPVGDLDSTLHGSLQIGRSRARARQIDLLEMMTSLSLITPLQPSDSDKTSEIGDSGRGHPDAFDRASLKDCTPVTAPVYWQFNTLAPIRLWALSERSPPFYKDLAVRTSAEGELFWQELQHACRDKDYIKDVQISQEESATGAFDENSKLSKSLRRTVSWTDSYVLSWHQCQYLHKFLDASTGATPRQDEDGGEARLSRICWVISAPRPVVVNFYEKTRARHIQHLESAKRKAKREAAEAKAKQDAEYKAMFARKLTEGRAQREQLWEDMFQRIHPGPLKGSVAIHVRRVRTRFVNSGSKDVDKWESEIRQAIQDANFVAETLLASARPQSVIVTGPSARTEPSLPTGPSPQPAPPLSQLPASSLLPPPLAHNPSEKPVESLIAQQGPPLQPKAKKPKRRAKKDDTPKSSIPQRRNRFQWNHDYDELAKDAWVVIKARCRNQRIDWSGYEQAFPAIPRNSVRQRVDKLKETYGVDIYLQRLEARWHDLWVQYRGTEFLPDDDPASPSNFDVAAHIEFLRKHIDKNALRVGYSRPRTQSNIVIPTTVDELLDAWGVDEKPQTTAAWDFMWNSYVEEGREKVLSGIAFTSDIEPTPPVAELSTDFSLVAESALKMTFTTPKERYDANAASRLLHGLGQQTVSVATSDLLNQGVISKLVRDPAKMKPGRVYKISDANQAALGGSVSSDVFQDAAALEDTYSERPGEWQEWPLLSTDGDLAALTQLVSDNKVNFKIDASQVEASCAALDWNSKKADDDDIETAIHVQFHDIPTVSSASPFGSLIELTPAENPMEIDDDGHEVSIDGAAATCRKQTEGIVDCQACLDSELSSLLAGLDQEETDAVNQILEKLREAKSLGLTRAQLVPAPEPSSEAKFISVIRRLTDRSVPLAYWVGYAHVSLVLASFVQPWTVVVSENPTRRVFPRRWIDITGSRMNDLWEMALHAVLGLLAFRPGISQAELRWRLRFGYDRQEVHELLQFLLREGYIERRVVQDRTKSMGERDYQPIPGDDEEKCWLWFLTEDKHWYHAYA